MKMSTLLDKPLILSPKILLKRFISPKYTGNTFKSKSVWTFPAVSAKSIGHPAPFPEELPTRLIKLYSFKDDVVLDPFLGSGTTSLSAVKYGRSYIGYDTNKKYIELANRRVAEYKNQTKLF